MKRIIIIAFITCLLNSNQAMVPNFADSYALQQIMNAVGYFTLLSELCIDINCKVTKKDIKNAHERLISLCNTHKDFLTRNQNVYFRITKYLIPAYHNCALFCIVDNDNDLVRFFFCEILKSKEFMSKQCEPSEYKLCFHDTYEWAEEWLVQSLKKC